MKRKYKTCLLFLCLSSTIVFGQPGDYSYRRQIGEISDAWHTVKLPDDIFGKLENDLFDLRIFGFNGTDTIEAPYILEKSLRRESLKEITFKQLNSSRIGTLYYYTFKILPDEIINQIDLEFERNNFDYLITLEGSNNQQQWFEIPGRHRIIAIQDGSIDYKYTTLRFPDSNFRFYRISFESSRDPELIDASIYETITDTGRYYILNQKNLKITEDKSKKTTIIEIELPKTVPLSGISVLVDNDFDYYRPFELNRIIDSIKTPGGWKKLYSPVENGYISSVNTNNFWFEPVLTNKIELTIFNNSNHPLDIGNIVCKSNMVTLKARFQKDYIYYLYYGNKDGSLAEYDIALFQNNIPDICKEVTTGDEEKLKSDETDLHSKITLQKYWLWIVMGIIVLVLALFTIKMIRNAPNKDVV